MVRRRVVTRREVLTLSARLFAENGYRSTSLELVAEQLGVTRQALYYHFKSKTDILGALFDEAMTKLESAIEQVPDGPVIDGRPRFLAMVDAHFEATLANADLISLLLHERPEMNRIKSLRAAKRRRDHAETFINAYEEGKTAGMLRNIDSWLVTNTVIAAINSVSMWHHGPRAMRQDELRRQIDELIVSAVSNPK